MSLTNPNHMNRDIMSDIDESVAGLPREGQKPLNPEEFKAGDKAAKAIKARARHEAAMKAKQPEEVLELTEDMAVKPGAELPAVAEKMELTPVAEVVEQELLEAQAKADVEKAKQEQQAVAWNRIAMAFETLSNTVRAMKEAGLQDVPMANYVDMAKTVVNQVAEENPGLTEAIVNFGKEAGAQEGNYDKGLRSIAESLTTEFKAMVKTAAEYQPKSKEHQLNVDKWLRRMRQVTETWLKNYAGTPRAQRAAGRPAPVRRLRPNGQNGPDRRRLAA